MESFKKRLTKDLAEYLNPEEDTTVEEAFERALEGMVERIKPREEVEKLKATERELDRKLEKGLRGVDDFDEWL